MSVTYNFQVGDLFERKCCKANLARLLPTVDLNDNGLDLYVDLWL